MRGFGRVVALLLFGMAVLFLDFFTKAYVYCLIPVIDFSTAYPYGGIGVFQNFLGIDFSISLALNKGAAWGYFADFQVLLLILRFCVIGGMLIYLMFINKNRRIDFPLVLVIAGAVGNVVDFFLYGFVVDFFHFNLWGYHFPVFNVADAAITVGVIWLFLVASFSKRHEARTKYTSS